ncbi:ZYRO0F12100p [Zygosaccharomyces rouxii]|uniref:ZYRO0F12100p n=1 Tax=Zygosaccharomyces rouxii (strain ATCC 2623 / CBS 732 / NBRC 1130 / NCYC 568 / NRRL Y-229) TaxID=559307 RepID=C5DYD2_ZYGRC|nr:uncharacterized protein ZYRO0F12100g [Zygosaccharomyces rouxii]KAH9199552.1 hypothetical protein LQ764DRAFT_131670 [Zygosaccharomyces rouxii]CAR28793.1 ZYRO0F12100p [Zygosaccharomyces rouxii]
MIRFRFTHMVRYHSTSHFTLPLSTSSLKDSPHSNLLLDKLKDTYLNGKLVVGHENATESLNSTSSLPMTQFPKNKIFVQVAQDDNVGSWRKPFVKWFRLGVYMVKYYKEGVKNTYRLAKDTRPLIKQYKDRLSTELCKSVEFKEIEHRLKKRAGSEPIELLPLNRRQFVEFHRRREARKIPVFFVLALAFEEFTAVICYLWPKVAPHNCLTPGAFAKITRSHVNHELGQISEVPTYKSPYTLPTDQVFAKLKSSFVEQTPRWKLALYQLVDNKVLPRETLVRIHHYLFVDDWLLLQHILHNESTVLAPAELVDCIMLRQLYRSEEDLNVMANDPQGQRVLVWRLLIYWAFRFDKTITSGGESLFAERWGVNNVSILNYSGWENGDLIGTRELPILELR